MPFHSGNGLLDNQGGRVCKRHKILQHYHGDPLYKNKLRLLDLVPRDHIKMYEAEKGFPVHEFKITKSHYMRKNSHLG